MNQSHMPLDTYLGLCTEVYDLSKPDAPQEAYAFYRTYAKAAKGAILEPMCGTGRFLLPLCEEGFDIHGFDASPHMLKRLQEKAELKNLTPTVWQGFAQDLNRSEKYDMIFIPSGSFCLIVDEEQVRLVLKRFYEHLTESGVLLFEIETMNAVPELEKWRQSLWKKADGSTIVLSQRATLDSGVCTSLGKYEWVCEDQVIHTEVEEYKIKIHEHDKLEALLRAVRFQHIRTLKSFDTNQKPSAVDESIVYECRKKVL